MEAQQGAESTTTLQGPRNGAKPPRKTAALPCRATLRARTKAHPPKEKATRAKRVNVAAISLRPRGGSVGGVWAHGLTEIKSGRWARAERSVGGQLSGRWAVGGRWSVCRQPCVFGASWGFLRPKGGAPSLRFGRGQTPRQRRFAPALAPLGRASLTPEKSYHPLQVVGWSQKTHLSGLSMRTPEVLATYRCSQ